MYLGRVSSPNVAKNERRKLTFTALYGLYMIIAAAESIREFIADAVRFANAAGSLTTTANGGFTAMPSREEISRLLAVQGKSRD